MNKKGFGTLIFYAVILLGVFLFMQGASGGALFSSSIREDVTYTEFTQYLENSKLESVTVALGKNDTALVEGKLKTPTAEGTEIILLYAPENDITSLISEYNKAHPGKLEVSYETLSEESWSSILMTIMTVVVIGFFAFFLISQQGGGGGGKMMNFGKSKARMFAGAEKKVTFEDVAGADEEKQELEEIVDFLKAPEKYKKLGARIPKGVLLVGSPGTGKTLLARATAGEAGVPFFSISGSDFVEMFVGVGASRVRDLFDSAKKNSPCIIFIDEIDAVGRQRGAGLGGGNDEREQTLNQLLVEMDGFSEHQGIIILAATNRADILDPALLRPGRFDRQIAVHVPDVKGREAILKVHAKNKPLNSSVDLKTIARSTSGMTGADLANVMNEASLMAARNNARNISMNDIEEAIMRVIAGPAKKSMLITEEDKKITAYHEAGHAMVGTMLKECDPVHEITIIPRGMAAGITVSLPDNDNTHMSRQKLISTITMMLGGRAGEEVMLDDICTGASNDIERATRIARKMVTEWGMSDELGPINYGDDTDDVFIGRDLMRSKGVSDAVAAKIDEETKKIMESCYEKAKQIIEENKEKMDEVVKVLYEKETLSGDEFRQIVGVSPIKQDALGQEDEPENEEVSGEGATTDKDAQE